MRALLIQVVSLLVALGVERLIAFFTGVSWHLLAVALLQGAFAATLARWRGLAPWWLPIQALFPPAAVMLLSLHLPSWIYLAVFLFMLALYWSTFRTQVPFYPSGRATREAVARLLPPDGPVRFIDIGSGMGDLVLELADSRPDDAFTGIELAPLPWLISWARARVRGSRARFLRGDYEHLDFADFDVVFAYLSPAAMPALWHKARQQMRAGALLLSHEFPIAGAEPDFIVQPDGNSPSLYGWRF